MCSDAHSITLSIMEKMIKSISNTPSLNFIYFTTITKQVTLYTTFNNHARSHRRLRSDLVTTWPSHVPTSGIGLGSHR